MLHKMTLCGKVYSGIYVANVRETCIHEIVSIILISTTSQVTQSGRNGP